MKPLASYFRHITRKAKYAAAQKRYDTKRGYRRRVHGVGRSAIHEALQRVATERRLQPEIPGSLYAKMSCPDLDALLSKFRRDESEPDGLKPYPIDLLAAQMFRAGKMSHRLARGCTKEADAFTLLRADHLAGAGPEADYPTAIELAASPLFLALVREYRKANEATLFETETATLPLVALLARLFRAGQLAGVQP